MHQVIRLTQTQDTHYLKSIYVFENIFFTWLTKFKKKILFLF